jgi:hypothetical protein
MVIEATGMWQGADEGVDDRGVTKRTTENLGEKTFLQIERICMKREWL